MPSALQSLPSYSSPGQHGRTTPHLLSPEHANLPLPHPQDAASPPTPDTDTALATPTAPDSWLPQGFVPVVPFGFGFATRNDKTAGRERAAVFWRGQERGSYDSDSHSD
jgi:hypothetical protein